MTKFKKNILAGLLSLAMLASAGAATATVVENHSFPTAITASAETDYDWDDTTNTLTVKVDGFSIVSTEYKYDVENVIFADGVTSIASWGFMSCPVLTSVTIPKSVTTIGECAFMSCGYLTNATIPDGVESIGKDAFSSCTSLTSVVIPKSVTTISDGAFGFCSGMKCIELKGIPADFSEYAFMYTNAYLILPAGVTEGLPVAGSWHDGTFEPHEEGNYSKGHTWENGECSVCGIEYDPNSDENDSCWNNIVYAFSAVIKSIVVSIVALITAFYWIGKIFVPGN